MIGERIGDRITATIIFRDGRSDRRLLPIRRALCCTRFGTGYGQVAGRSLLNLCARNGSRTHARNRSGLHRRIQRCVGDCNIIRSLRCRLIGKPMQASVGQILAEDLRLMRTYQHWFRRTCRRCRGCVYRYYFRRGHRRQLGRARRHWLSHFAGRTSLRIGMYRSNGNCRQN